jgi:hypothetical protein
MILVTKEFSRISLRRGAGCVSKRGVDDGNQKGVNSLQPAQESHVHYIKIISFFKQNFKKKANLLGSKEINLIF